jgi:hypothetical protein
MKTHKSHFSLTLDDHVQWSSRQIKWHTRNANAYQCPERTQHMEALLICSCAVRRTNYTMGTQARGKILDFVNNVNFTKVKEVLGSER